MLSISIMQDNAKQHQRAQKALIELKTLLEKYLKPSELFNSFYAECCDTVYDRINAGQRPIFNDMRSFVRACACGVLQSWKKTKRPYLENFYNKIDNALIAFCRYSEHTETSAHSPIQASLKRKLNNHKANCFK